MQRLWRGLAVDASCRGITSVRPPLAVGMWAGFLIFVLVLGLGGPTGIAANPARDLGPRIAHWILPIPGGSDRGHAPERGTALGNMAAARHADVLTPRFSLQAREAANSTTPGFPFLPTLLAVPWEHYYSKPLED